VPSEHPTIFGAVDSASYGDTILVEPGTYYREREKELPDGLKIWIEMKDGITLMSEAGPEATTLVETAPDMYNTTIYCDSIADAVIQGFTIMVDDAVTGDNWDIGIRLLSTDMVVENNVLHNFSYEAIAVVNESPHSDTPVIRDNEIYDCLAGIYIYDVWTRDCPSVVGNHIHDCWNYGIYCLNSAPYIGTCIIENNALDGIRYIGYGDGIIEGSKIVNNGWNGVTAIMDYVLNTPCLNCTWRIEMANDVHGNGNYDVYYWEETGAGLLEARMNYWGTMCPDPSQFYGRVNWTPWTDSTHSTLCSDCDSCGNAIEPATWGAIKAMFR
jgi:hypothetical protein